MTRLLVLSVLVAAPVALAAATVAIAPREVHPFLEWGVVDVEYMLVIEAEDGRTAFRRIGPDQCLAKYQDGPITCEEIDFSFAPPEVPPVVGSLLPPGTSPGGGGGGGGGNPRPPFDPLDPIRPVDPVPPIDPILPPIPLPATGWLFLLWIAAFLYMRKTSNG